MRRLLGVLGALLLAPAPALAGTVISTGHVDVGPRLVDGRWSAQLYDEPTWRAPEDVVLRVRDAATVEVPDDPAYAFLDQAPGTEVFVIPQTQNPDVVWLGWNTQDPEVMESIDRGVTMTMTGVQGPGRVVVYLQSGDFAEPDVLWDSEAEPAPVWVDVNTHTHANWVFSKPGVYLVQVKLEADLVDGTTVSDTRLLRFAVGSSTSTGEALTASWRAAKAPTTAKPTATTNDDAGGVPIGVLLAVGAALLAAGFTLLLARGRAAKRRARA